MFAAAALRVKANLEGTDSSAESEIRRFSVEKQSPDSSAFSSLKKKVSEVFPSLQNSQNFKLYWKDPEEGEKIAFSSEEEMNEAVSQAQSKDGTFSIFVKRDRRPDKYRKTTDLDPNSPSLRAFRAGAVSGWDDNFGTPDSDRRSSPWGHLGRHWGGMRGRGCGFGPRGRGVHGRHGPPPFHPSFTGEMPPGEHPPFPPSFPMAEGMDEHPTSPPPPTCFRGGWGRGWRRGHPYMRPDPRIESGDNMADSLKIDGDGENKEGAVLKEQQGPTGSTDSFQGAGQYSGQVDCPFGGPGLGHDFGPHGYHEHHGFGHGHGCHGRHGRHGYKRWCQYMHQLHQDLEKSSRDSITDVPQEGNVIGHDLDMDIDNNPSGHPEPTHPADQGDIQQQRPEDQAARISEGLHKLQLQGYRNDNGWLSRLLVEHNGDTRKVLEVIQPKEN